MSEFPSFLRLNHIPLYGQTAFCFSIHLGCLHLLAIENNAAINVGVQIFESLLSVILGIYLVIKESFEDEVKF